MIMRELYSKFLDINFPFNVIYIIAFFIINTLVNTNLIKNSLLFDYMEEI